MMDLINLNSGFFRAGKSNLTSIQSLLGDFIKDRSSPSLIEKFHRKEKKFLSNSRWGEKGPLGRVINSDDDLKEILSCPDFYCNSICIIEPAAHVGTNPYGEDVRASTNIAFLCQFIADCNSILIPLWKTGPLDNKLFHQLLKNSLICFVEGGYPTLKDGKSFQGTNINLDYLQKFSMDLLLSRDLKSSPSIFICLGHQLAGQGHIEILKKATTQIQSILDKSIISDFYYKNLISKCEKIISIGENLCIYKDEKVVAKGWNDSSFAVALNLKPEVGKVNLENYKHSSLHPNDEFLELLMSHELAHEHELGVIEKFISYEKNLHIEMFHSDVVNQEAILFANWAYGELHKALYPIRKEISISDVSWLLEMPASVEIVCSTTVGGKVCTEVAATCINYLDYQTLKNRRSFTFQFHPELLEELSAFNISGFPEYQKLKEDDGIRLLARVMYESIIN